MDIEQFKQHVDARLDKLEDKLDNYQQRVSKAEEAIDWLRGSAKIILSLIVAVGSGLMTAILRRLV